MARHDGEAADGWRKSSSSGDQNCVEIRIGAQRVDVRDAKNRAGAVLSFTHAEWRAFLTGVHGGEFELPAVYTS